MESNDTRQFFYGYYVSFNATGCGSIDDVLRTVADACRNYHHTENWSEGADGETNTDKIQLAAQKSAEEFERLEALVRHCWIHSGYHNCGFLQMTTEQKALFTSITEEEPQ